MSRVKAEEIFLRRFDAAVAGEEDERKRRALTCVRSHSKRVAEAASEIAKRCGMDEEEVYICGLLHDIGKSAAEWSISGLNHVLLGYDILMAEGLEAAARVAMTHTFYGYKEIPRKDFWTEMGAEEARRVQDYMNKCGEMNDVDLLIQLVDNMVHDVYVMTVSDRFCDILMRHQMEDAGLHVKKLYEIKQYFDEKCGMNIYEIFRDDIIKTALEEPNKEYKGGRK